MDSIDVFVPLPYFNNSPRRESRNEHPHKMKNLKQNKGLNRVLAFTTKCIAHLVVTQNLNRKKAEDIVFELVKDSEDSLLAGDYDMVIASLKMVVFDETPEQAAKSIIKKF